MAGAIPIGWGKVDDAASIRALEKSVDLGINFFDTADFYGFGHSEALIGKVLGNRRDVIIATKIGHRLANDNSIVLDYSKTALSLSFVLSLPEVSTVIPGIKTVEQAVENTADIVQLRDEDMKFLKQFYRDKLCKLVDLMEKQN